MLLCLNEFDSNTKYWYQSCEMLLCHVTNLVANLTTNVLEYVLQLTC